jgi:hypothetical protein
MANPNQYRTYEGKVVARKPYRSNFREAVYTFTASNQDEAEMMLANVVARHSPADVVYCQLKKDVPTPL